MCRTRKAEQPVDSLFSGSLKKARLVINRWVNNPEKWTSLTDCARKGGYTGDLSNLHREARRLKVALDKIPVTSCLRVIDIMRECDRHHHAWTIIYNMQEL